MGVSYYIVNTTKRQYFVPWRLLSGDRFSGLLTGISGHALALLIRDGRGDWCGDALYAVGDCYQKSAVHDNCTQSYPANTEASEILHAEYVDITVALIGELCERDDLAEDFLNAAQTDDDLFITLAIMVKHFDFPRLRGLFMEKFRKDWRRRYNQAMAKSGWSRELTDMLNLEALADILPALRDGKRTSRRYR